MYLTKRHKVFNITPTKNLACSGIGGEILALSPKGLEMFKALRDSQPVDCPAPFLETLQKKHFLFSSQAEEEAAFEEVCTTAWAGFNREVPRQFTFILNAHCNFTCPYCFEPEAFRAHPNTLTEEKIDAAFRVVDALENEQPEQDAQQNPAQFEIFGGEPLLPGSRSNLEYLIRQIEQRGKSATLQTNGYFLSAALDVFRKYQDTIRQIQVTLDGPPEIHNKRRVPRSGEPTFERIVTGIDRLLAEDLPLNINLRMNVDRTNIAFIETMAQFYHDKGWTAQPNITFVAAPVDNRSGSIRNPELLVGWHEVFERVLPLSVDMGNGPFDLSIFKQTNYFRHFFNTIGKPDHLQPVFTPKVLYCEAAALKLYVFHTDGSIYPCPEGVGMEPLAIGRYFPEWVMDSDSMKLWQSQTILTRAQCRDCDIATFCGGGCVLNALLKNGSMSVPECENAEEVLQAYFQQIGQAVTQ